MRTYCLAAALAASTALSGAAWAQSQTLTTTFDGGNSASGNAFDIEIGATAITLQSLEVHTQTTGTANISVFTRLGTVVGTVNSAVGWTQVADVTVNSMGRDTPTPLDLPDVVFEANERYGVFIVITDGSTMIYTNAPSFGTQAVTNGDVTIFNGFGIGAPDGGGDAFSGRTFSPRTWNGSLIYVLDTGSASDAELAQLIAAVGGSASVVVVDASGVARDLGQVSLATRDAVDGFERDGDGTVTLSTRGAPGLTNGVYTWAEITSFLSTENGSGAAEVGGTGVQIGADIAVGPDMVAGVSLGYSQISASDGAFSQDGDLVYVQPYFSYRSGAWHGNASVIYGQGSFDQTSIAGEGTADITLAAVTFEGGYDFTLSEQFTVTPTLGLIHGQQETRGTGGTLTGTEMLTFTQASLGARITFEGADGRMFAGLHADYLTQDTGLVLANDLLSEDGWTGRVELGASTDLGSGLGLSTSINLSGLGGDMETISGGLRIAFTF